MNWKWEGWNAIAAIGQCAGAFATFLAAWLALRLAREAGRINIKVKTSYGVVMPSMAHIITFSAINLSKGKITLTSWGILMPNKIQLMYLIQPGFPVELEQWACHDVRVSPTDVAQGLIENKFSEELTLKVYFYDSLGQRHWGKLRINPRQWISS